MARVDYLDDPNAPEANSIVPAVSAIVTDADERMLMILRTDNGYWSIPGGGINPGETPRQATAREVKEETGIDCQVSGIVGIYSNPNHVAAYDDGEVRQEFSICFTTQMLGGNPATSDESAEVRFVSPADIDDYNIHQSIRLRIGHYLEGRAVKVLFFSDALVFGHDMPPGNHETIALHGSHRDLLRTSGRFLLPVLQTSLCRRQARSSYHKIRARHMLRIPQLGTPLSVPQVHPVYALHKLRKSGALRGVPDGHLSRSPATSALHQANESP